MPELIVVILSNLSSATYDVFIDILPALLITIIFKTIGNIIFSLLVCGFVTVSIGSVVLAGFLAPLLINIAG